MKYSLIKNSGKTEFQTKVFNHLVNGIYSAELENIINAFLDFSIPLRFLTELK